MPIKERLDLSLVSRGLVETRSKAQALIMAGHVEVNSRVASKAGQLVSEEDHLVVSAGLPYASRGGLKLERALAYFGLQPRGQIVVDVGASTGGFTDCWLQHGAAEVYAIDVGYGQLDWALRNDPRVHVLERTNARYLTLEQLSRTEPVDMASIDASFIGLSLLLRPLTQIVSLGGLVVALVKPQFEAGRERLDKGGVVRNPAVHAAVLETVMQQARDLDFAVRGVTPSPIRGPEGNIEFLLLLDRTGTSVPVDVQAVVAEAWGGTAT